MLAILCQLNHVTQRRRLQVQAQHLASETTACTEMKWMLLLVLVVIGVGTLMGAT